MISELFAEDDIRSDKIVADIYISQKNYRIKENNSDNKRCLICFSGNKIYYPNNEEAFKSAIIQNDRFEYSNITNDKKIMSYFGKIIYFRDVYKQWYLNGINSETNSIEKIVEVIKAQTTGYEIYTMGNSAGGFTATLIGAMLNAKAVYSFSGQFDLTVCLDSEPFIKYGKDIKDIQKYYNLLNYINNSSTDIFYFQPALCQIDQKQYDYVASSDKVYRFGFNTDKHGASINSYTYKYLLTMDTEKLKHLYKKYKGRNDISHIDFLIKSAGILKASIEIVKKIVHK